MFRHSLVALCSSKIPQNDIREMIKTVTSILSSQIDNVDKIQKSIENEKYEHKINLQILKDEHRTEIFNLNNNNRSEIQYIKSKHNESLTEMKLQKDAKLKEHEYELHKLSLANNKDYYGIVSKRLEEDGKIIIDKDKFNDLSNQISDAHKNIAEMKVKHSKELEQLKIKYANENSAKLAIEKDKLEQIYKTRHATLIAEHDQSNKFNKHLKETLDSCKNELQAQRALTKDVAYAFNTVNNTSTVINSTKKP